MRRYCFIILVVVFIAGLVVGTPHETVSACSIGVASGPLPTRNEQQVYIADQFGQMDAVFRGRVIAVGGIGPEAITFQTDQWWKGEPTATVAVRAVANGCGYAFTLGQEYIVYAQTYRGGFGEAFTVSPGTASHPAPTTDVEDEAFGPGVSQTPTGRMTPSVGRWFDLLMGGGDVGVFEVWWR